ncbi:MAG: cation:proton antiporter [Leptolyngbyaceae cyanobacterium]
MDAILGHFSGEPIVTFALLLAIILPVPILVEKLGLPGLIGLLLAGIILGPNSLDLLNPDEPVMELLSDIGLLYLMFIAGLEIDMQQFQKVKFRSAGFGSLTFLVPLLTGVGLSQLMGFSWVSSVLVGSLIASHSLLAYPVISQAGVTRNPAVVTTLGATIFTDIGALIVLAICVSLGEGDFSLLNIVRLLVGLSLYAVAILYGFDLLGKIFFRRSDSNQGNQFLFALLVVFIAALGAELIGVEKIVGAFLAGLAINEVVGDSPVKEKIVFVGTVLFVPIFFVDIGLLIDVTAFVQSPQALIFAALLIIGLLISKFIAAWMARWLYQYDRAEMLTMWGMTLPQVATTLAAALVGNRAGLISEAVLNSVVVMMLVTAVLGPLVVRRTVRNLAEVNRDIHPENDTPTVFAAQTQDFSVLVPICNPKTEEYLLELAGIFARAKAGVVKPLAIAPAQSKLDSPKMNRSIAEREQLLQTATAFGQGLDVAVEPLLRIDHRLADCISRTAREQRANLLVMGLNKSHFNLQSRFLGDLIDDVLWMAHCPVAIVRLLASPLHVQSILIPIKLFSTSEVNKIRLAIAIAQQNQSSITLLHVTSTRLSPERENLEADKLMQLVGEAPESLSIVPKVVHHRDVAKAILEEANHHDLVVSRTQRQRTQAGLKIGSTSSRLVKNLDCSLILFGEPEPVA